MYIIKFFRAQNFKLNLSIHLPELSLPCSSLSIKIITIILHNLQFSIPTKIPKFFFEPYTLTFFVHRTLNLTYQSHSPLISNTSIQRNISLRSNSSKENIKKNTKENPPLIFHRRMTKASELTDGGKKKNKKKKKETESGGFLFTNGR